MVKRFFLTTAALALLGSGASAATITIGDHILDFETPGQSVGLYLSDPITLWSMQLGLQVGNGSAGPIMTAVDLKTGTVIPAAYTQYDVFNTGWTAGSSVDGAEASISPGRLVTITFSTVGVAPGDYTLSLETTWSGFPYTTEYFTPPDTLVLFDFTPGNLTVVPEPAMMSVIALSGLMLLRRQTAAKA